MSEPGANRNHTLTLPVKGSRRAHVSHQNKPPVKRNYETSLVLQHRNHVSIIKRMYPRFFRAINDYHKQRKTFSWNYHDEKLRRVMEAIEQLMREIRGLMARHAPDVNPEPEPCGNVVSYTVNAYVPSPHAEQYIACMKLLDRCNSIQNRMRQEGTLRSTHIREFVGLKKRLVKLSSKTWVHLHGEVPGARRELTGFNERDFRVPDVTESALVLDAMAVCE